jgi:hypothetical protein
MSKQGCTYIRGYTSASPFLVNIEFFFPEIFSVQKHECRNMIASGTVLLFISFVVDSLWNVGRFSEAMQKVVGWTTLIGATLIVAGVATLAWEYLP